MCVELTMKVSILSLRQLSDPVEIFLASVRMKVGRQDNPVFNVRSPSQTSAQVQARLGHRALCQD